jgi:hypothetical protein
MTEVLHEPNEFDAEPAHELPDTEQRAEIYVQNVLLQGSQLAYRTFDTEAEALEANEAHVEACTRIAKSIHGLEGVDMMARGEGVRVANVQPLSDSQTGIMSFKTNPEQPLVSLSMFDERPFHYKGIVSGATEIDKNVWKVHSFIVGEESTRKNWKFNRIQFGFPMLQISLESMIVIPTASEDVQIEVTPLELQRQRTEALEELAKQDVEQIGFVDDVNKVHEVFLGETKYLVKFPEVALLRKIGSKGMLFGSQGNKQADALNTALIKTIQPKRPLVIDGRLFKADDNDRIVATHTAGFNGTVIDVISQLPTTEKNIGPTLVMMSVDDDRIHYAPLTNITSLKF